MKCILVCGQEYFKGNKNLYDHRSSDFTTDPQEATIFEMEIIDGKVVITPSLPNGDWDIKQVTLSF